MNRWSKNGVRDRVFEQLHWEQLVYIRIEAVKLDSTTVKVQPDGMGAFKKTDRRPSANSRGGWTTKTHLVAANAGTAITFALSPGRPPMRLKAANCWVLSVLCPRPCT